MDAKEKLVFGVAAIVGGSMIVAAYLMTPPRFVLVSAGDSVAFRLDGATGNVSWCSYSECFPVEVKYQRPAPPAAGPPTDLGNDMSVDANLYNSLSN